MLLWKPTQVDNIWINCHSILYLLCVLSLNVFQNWDYQFMQQLYILQDLLDKVYLGSHLFFKHTVDYIRHLIIHDVLYSVRHLLKGRDLKRTFVTSGFYSQKKPGNLISAHISNTFSPHRKGKCLARKMYVIFWLMLLGGNHRLLRTHTDNVTCKQLLCDCRDW